jgi:hypothetical protein
MIRPAVIALLACIYIAFSVWLVGKQGQAYREELRRERVAAVPAEKPAPAQPELKNVVPASAPAVPKSTASAPDAAPAVTAITPSVTKKAPDRSRRPPAKSGRSQSEAETAPVVEHRPAGKAATPADPLASNPLWNTPQMMRNWDVANLSAADEQKLGAELHEVIVGLNPVASDGPWRQRLVEAAKPFLAARTRNDIRYTFEVMESNEVNAFSHPGGYVYVNRGLFDLVGEDEDYALQFAVGCEIAHVDLRHAIKCLHDPDFKVMTGGTIRKLYWLILPLGYLVTDKVNQDFEADEWTFTRMRGFGRSKRETLAFLYKLDGYATRHGFRDGRAKVRLGVESASFLDIHYRRQTAAWERLDHLKEKFK